MQQDLKFALTGAAALAAAGACSQREAELPKPLNVVYIMCDDHSYQTVSAYDQRYMRTPNIDRLASEGLLFERFFQATAMSSPTRQCLLTGLYPVRSGAYPNHTFIQPGVRTLPSYLKDCGYRVATQGKRHYAPLAQFPFEYLDPMNQGNAPLNPGRVEPFLRDVAASGEPFFLYLCSTDPHSPWTRGDQSLFDPDRIVLPENLVDTPQTRRQYCDYLAEINLLDKHVGMIDAMLEKYGLTENTIFIFTSEQGYSFPFAKWTLYDEGLQTGFIVRWPGVIKAGSRTAEMCEYVDITPTLIDIAGGKRVEGLDGRSFKKILLGRGKGKKQVYGIHTSRGIIAGPEHYGIRSVRDGRYLYIRNLTPEARFHCAAFRDLFFQSWEAIADSNAFAARQVERYAVRPAEELYDVQADPFQQHNLAGEKASARTLAKMRRLLDDWMERQGDKGQETEMDAFQHMAAKMGVK